MPRTSTPHYTVFVIPHTHWDREWYQPFRVFQARLVDVIDAVLALLEDPRYRRFTLDGQAAILDDYLELRPEREPDLRHYVQAGRLRIGPWYVLADEFLVSPEALIRNLFAGRRVSRRFGEPLPVCYTPDSFGHISQLPLLAAGFGLNAIVFQRGVGDDAEAIGSEFTWVAADGATEVFSVHLIGTYSGGTALGHVDWELTDPYDEELAIEHLRAALYGTAGEALARLPEWFRTSLERVPGGLTAHTRSNVLVLLNGSDHLFPQPNIPEVLKGAARAFPEAEFVHGDVEEFVNAARAGATGLHRHQGEFRGSRYHHILAGVLSTRLYLKQANEACEIGLERYAEPLSALAWWESGYHPSALIHEAWRLLLLNQPHDSICGCSIDAVHREMLTRFDNVQQLTADLCRRAFSQLGGGRPSNIQEVHETAKDAITVYNPLPYRRTAVVHHHLDLPLGSAAGLGVFGPNGEPLPMQLTRAEAFAPGQNRERVERVSLEIVADLEPLGITNLRLTYSGMTDPAEAPQRSEQRSALPQEQPAEAPTTNPQVTAAAGPNGVVMSNGLLTLSVTPDGRAELLEHGTGTSRQLHLRLEDEGDAGDEYDFSPVAGDEPLVFTAPTEGPLVVAAGPVTATTRVRYTLELPERLSDDRKKRVGAVVVPVVIDLTLHSGEPLLRATVKLDNAARDHRLRLRIATGTTATTVWADGHFDVLERPLRPTSGSDWFQIPPPSNHQRRFVAVSDGSRGLAILNRGLPEYEAFPGSGDTELAVTLVRSVGWLSRSDLGSRPQGAGPALPTPEAQCLGKHTFHLAFYPFGGPWWQSRLQATAQAFTTPPMTSPGHTLNPPAGLLELTGPFDLSAVKRAEERDSLIVRIANPSPVGATGNLRFARPVSGCYRTRLDETRVESLGAINDLPLRLGPRSVTSFEFVPEGGDVQQSGQKT